MSYDFDVKQVLDVLNRVLENEMAGVVRYTHYSLMVFGPYRMPLVAWLQGQASESLLHSQEAGELITLLDGHPSLKIGSLLESHQHDVKTILQEALAHETEQVGLYRELLDLVKDKSVLIEEFARKLIAEEEQHVGDIQKMIREH
ncbi:MAG: ferritin-like domain-containing protein [Vampirovibrionales bacterium]|nr:ferritin-like domain-containing protein [Vampirovibrionales bacterium]